jgi:hypothetical protein
MPRRETVDELYANIEIKKFIKDVENGLSIIELKRKYHIYSAKAIEAFVKSLINSDLLDKRIKTIRKPIKKAGLNISKASKKRESLTKSSMLPTIEHTERILKNGNKSKEDKTFDEELEIELTLDSNILDEEDEISLEENGNEYKTKDLPDSSKKELIRLWNLGVPMYYICEKLEISSQTLQHWRTSLGLKKRPFGIVTNPSGHLRKLQSEIIGLEILKLMNNNLGALYLDDVITNLHITEKVAKESISRITALKVCRLYFYGTGEDVVQHSVECFYNKSFSIIVYVRTDSLLLKLSNIMIHHPNKDKFDDTKLKMILESLLKNNPTIGSIMWRRIVPFFFG